MDQPASHPPQTRNQRPTHAYNPPVVIVVVVVKFKSDRLTITHESYVNIVGVREDAPRHHQHRTGCLDRSAIGYRLTSPAGTLGPDSLGSGRVPPAHGSSHSQLTAAEPQLVQNVDMSAHVIKQLEYVS